MVFLDLLQRNAFVIEQLITNNLIKHKKEKNAMKGQSSNSQLQLPYSTQSARLNGCSQHPQILAHFFKRRWEEVPNQGFLHQNPHTQKYFIWKIGFLSLRFKKSSFKFVLGNPPFHNNSNNDHLQQHEINHPKSDYYSALTNTKICSYQLFCKNASWNQTPIGE